MLLDVKNMDYAVLNQKVREIGVDVEIVNCQGQRFVGAGLSEGKIIVNGIPGNAFGAYLNGAAKSL